ncbi:MAG TPA: TonB-dependent receptor [Blastocatellia bacterium]|nr:TonB-dependent receptor [Blastocatellia bacterium]
MINIFRMKGARRINSLYLSVAILLSLVCAARAAANGEVSGVVRDQSGAIVSDATVSLLTSQQAIVASAKTDAQGKFAFSDVSSGSYLLVVSSRGFADYRKAVVVGQAGDGSLEIVIEPRPITEEVTITTNPGVVESTESVSQQVNVISEAQIAERAQSVVAQVANEEVGVQLQRTSPTVSGIFIRGLTGNKVNVFVDGVRYSNAAQRGGVSSFFNLIDQTNLQAVEILRGPNSAQYGSDAIGGSIQFLTYAPAFAATDTDFRGKFGVSFNSADAGFGSNLLTTFATKKFALLTNITGRRVNTLRVGHEIDSHNAVTRFFALSSDLVLDDRLPDTAFTQYGGLIKMNYAFTPGSQLTLNYARSQQDGGKRYDQLLGGDGNLIADLRNFMLDFAYARYDKVKLGWFDTFTAVYSFNSQREERVNQGGNGSRTASINHEFERTNAHGTQAFVGKQWGVRNNLLLGGEFYHEQVEAPSFGLNPVTNVSSIRRGRVPDNAKFRSGGLYVQDVVDVVPGRLRLVGNVRWSAASYEARAADSPLVGGRPLWPDDSLRVDNVTYRAGVLVTPVDGFSLSANFSRGFRAPHITDLGTLGLTGSGFEVAAPDVAGLGGTIGTSAGSTAVSTGLPVTQVGPEKSMSYEVGARYHNRHFDTDFAFFVNDVDDNIVKQALILPPGAVGQLLGSTPITSQLANGVVFVAASTNPVLVRANFDDVRIYGFEHTFDARLTSDLTLGTIFTYLHAEDRRSHLPPNIEGGTPAPDGWFKLRYAPVSRKYWIEPYIHAAGRQDRLSSLDLEDRRTGAGRTRGAIANFFNNGARNRGLVSPGPDGIAGNADDRLIATGETLLQIQNRVLGVGVASAPLYTAVPGYITFNIRGGYRFGERHEVLIDFENIGDRNYRGISWGVDAPGSGVYLRYNTRF